MMGLGAFAFSMCAIYLVVWSVQGGGNNNDPGSRTHNALTDDDSIVAKKKRSHWD